MKFCYWEIYCRIEDFFWDLTEFSVNCRFIILLQSVIIFCLLPHCQLTLGFHSFLTNLDRMCISWYSCLESERKEEDELVLSPLFVFRIKNSAVRCLENHLTAEEICTIKLQMKQSPVHNFYQWLRSALSFPLFSPDILAVKARSRQFSWLAHTPASSLRENSNLKVR